LNIEEKLLGYGFGKFDFDPSKSCEGGGAVSVV
jgi:hypothetical protein